MRDKVVERLPLIVSISAILALALAYAVVPQFRDLINEMVRIMGSGEQDKIRDWISQYGAWGPLLIVLGMLLQMLIIFLPSWGLIIVSVLAYGPFWGSVLAVGAMALAASLGYFLGRFLSEATLEKFLGKKQMEKVTHYTCRYGFWTVFIVRLAPFLSNDVISFVGGMLHMGYVRFILATLAGITPLAVLLAFFAQSPEKLKQGLIWVSVGGLLALAGKLGFDFYKRRQT